MEVQAVLAAMLMMASTHGWAGDSGDNGEVIEERLTPWAKAIATEARGEDDAAAAIAVMVSESKLASYVLDNRCKDGPVGSQCDPDRHGDPRSIGPWQLRRVACPEAWVEGPLDPQVHARCALRLLRYHYSRCRGKNPHGDWAGAISGFNLGCVWKGAVRRDRLRRRVLAILYNMKRK